MIDEYVFIKLYSVMDRIQADIAVEFLKNNDIIAYRQGDGPGGIMDIYCGNSIYGNSIYVSRKDAEKAMELLDFLLMPVDEDKLS